MSWSWHVAVEKLDRELARANRFLDELDTFPELKSTPSAARVRWALAQAEELMERLYEHRRDPRAEVMKRVEDADKAIRVAQKAIDRARELMCFVRKAHEERKRFSQDLALRLERAKLQRQRAVGPQG